MPIYEYRCVDCSKIFEKISLELRKTKKFVALIARGEGRAFAYRPFPSPAGSRERDFALLGLRTFPFGIFLRFII